MASVNQLKYKRFTFVYPVRLMQLPQSGLNLAFTKCYPLYDKNNTICIDILPHSSTMLPLSSSHENFLCLTQQTVLYESEKKYEKENVLRHTAHPNDIQHSRQLIYNYAEALWVKLRRFNYCYFEKKHSLKHFLLSYCQQVSTIPEKTAC